MKFLIAFVGLVALASAEWKIQTHDDLIKYRNECVQKLSVPEDHVEQFKKWNFPDDEKTHCYIKCIFEKFGLFDETHGFNVEHLVEQLGQNKDHAEVRVEVNKCVDKNEQGTDACTWAYRGLKCFMANHLNLVQQSVKKD